MHFLIFIVYAIVCVQLGAVAYPLIETGFIEIGDNTIETEFLGDYEVFNLPSKLKIGYKINVTGKMKNREKFTVSLVTADKTTNLPDLKNIACQFRADFRTGKTTINTRYNGDDKSVDEGLPPAYLFTNTDFNIKFEIVNETKIEVHFGASTSDDGCDLRHNIEDITYLILGNVEKLEEINFLLV